MKKLIAILSACNLLGTPASYLVACAKEDKKENKVTNKNNENKVNADKNDDESSQNKAVELSDLERSFIFNILVNKSEAEEDNLSIFEFTSIKNTKNIFLEDNLEIKSNESIDDQVYKLKFSQKDIIPINFLDFFNNHASEDLKNYPIVLNTIQMLDKSISYYAKVLNVPITEIRINDYLNEEEINGKQNKTIQVCDFSQYDWKFKVKSNRIIGDISIVKDHRNKDKLYYGIEFNYDLTIFKGSDVVYSVTNKRFVNIFNVFNENFFKVHIIGRNIIIEELEKIYLRKNNVQELTSQQIENKIRNQAELILTKNNIKLDRIKIQVSEEDSSTHFVELYIKSNEKSDDDLEYRILFTVIVV